MASIKSHGENQWRAQICKSGVRKSRVFQSVEQAEAWAARVEAIYSKKVVFSGPKTVLRAQVEAPYDRSEILAAAIPHPESAGVYFLIWRGDIIYIGQSNNVLWRIAKHRYEGRKFDAYTVVGCAPEHLDRLEQNYIRAVMPDGNMTLGNREVTSPTRRPQRPARESEATPAA